MRSLAHRLVVLALASAPAVVIAADAQPYTYVKFPLGVPWALYFVFLALVLVPFAVMIVLAWRRWFHEAEKSDAE